MLINPAKIYAIRRKQIHGRARACVYGVARAHARAHECTHVRVTDRISVPA